MGKVDRDLALCIGIFGGLVVAVLGDDFADSKLASNAQRQRADDGSWSKIGEPIAMPAYIFLRPLVAVHEGSIWRPGVWWLISQLLAAWVSSFYSVLHLLIDCILDFGLDPRKLWCDPSDILKTIRFQVIRVVTVPRTYCQPSAIVVILSLLAPNFIVALNIKARCMWTGNHILKELEGYLLV